MLKTVRATLYAATASLALAMSMAAGPLAPTPAMAQDVIVPADELNAAIRRYLLENPEVIVQALELYRDEQEAQQAQAQADALKRMAPQLTRLGIDPIAGNPDGSVTMVEFFDYQCGFCKRMHADKDTAVANDGDVRIVYKELPILGPMSEVASRAALAARAQDKYLEMHNALMTHNGRLSEAVIFDYARKLGLDVDQLRAEMQSEAVGEVLATNRSLARALNITGTPALIIGDGLYPGAMTLAELEDAIAAARG